MALTSWAAVSPSAASSAFDRACALLHRALGGDPVAARKAARAFRDALSGPFAERSPHFGIAVADALLREQEGHPPVDPAFGALLRRDYSAAARIFAQRGGIAAELGARLVRGLERVAAPDRGGR